jgi:ABC-type branched-subunit amino acid transport system substrate-binding protein
LENKIEEKISRYPDPYYANAYDALWVAALTENATKGIKDIQTLKQKLYEMANSYFGLTGKTSLDENGDRKYGTYDFWIINEKDDNKGYEWIKVKNSTSIQLNTKMN